MQIKIKRLDKTLPLPEYKTSGAAAFDLSARLSTTIEAKSIGYIPLNVVIATPPGFVLKIFARSGTHKRGLMKANSVGIIDPDFSGPDDEVKAVYYNFTDEPVTITKWERIAQGLIQKVESVEWEEVPEMEAPTRGAFGTTGDK